MKTFKYLTKIEDLLPGFVAESDLLMKMGNEGWELVSVMSRKLEDSIYSRVVYYFKKEKVEAGA